MKLDIGGGTSVPEGFTNLDPIHGEGKLRCRVQDGIPLPDESVEEVRASHVLEHIPAGDPRIFTMNEVHRVLIPGGIFQIWVPMFPHWQAVADPTHLSYWCAESFMYFTGQRAQADYGILYWEWVGGNVREGWELHGVLRKPLGATAAEPSPDGDTTGS